MAAPSHETDQILQAAADSRETEVMETYRLRRAVATAIADAVRRAEVAMRLESRLRMRETG